MDIVIQAKGYINNEKIPFLKINGKYLFDYTLDILKLIPYENLLIITDIPEEISDYLEKNDIKFELITPNHKQKKSTVFLDVDAVYDDASLGRWIKKEEYKKINDAILWKIENPNDVKRTEEHYLRQTWNPVARYYAVPVGEQIARLVSQHTQITANQITLFSGVIGILAAIFFSVNNYFMILLGAVFLQFFHVFDVADGFLARIKNNTTEFGAYFDSFFDSFVFYLCIIGITLNVQNIYPYEKIWFLTIGILFGAYMGSYLQNMKLKFLKKDASKQFIMNAKGKFKVLINIHSFFNYWDVKLLVITVCAILNQLIFSLFYLFIINNFWIFNIILEYRRYTSEKNLNNAES